MHLGVTIQSGAHDSAVDADATLRLLCLKLERGPSYGVLREGCDHLAQHAQQEGGTKSLMIDRRDVLNQLTTPGMHMAECASDNQVVDRLEGYMHEMNRGDQNLFIASLSDVYEMMEDSAATLQQHGVQRSSGVPPSELKRITCVPEEALARMAERVARVHAALPPGSVMVAVSGGGNTAAVRACLGETSSARKESFAMQNAQRAASKELPHVQQLMKRASMGYVGVGWR